MRRFAVLLLAAGGLSSCGAFYKHYRDVPAPDGLSFEQVWDACLQSANAASFRLDRKSLDRGLKTFTTAWRTRLRAFGKGRRYRAVFEIETEDGERFLVRYYVERQKVADMARQLRPVEDDWEGDGQDPDLELQVSQQLRGRLAALAGRPMPRPTGVRIEDPMRRLKPVK